MSVAQYCLHHKSFCLLREVQNYPSTDLCHHRCERPSISRPSVLLNCHALQALRKSRRAHIRCGCHNLSLPLRCADVAQVRAVASPTDNLVLSASRDTTAISWTRPSSSTPFQKQAVLRAGSRFVSAVTYIPPSPGAPEGESILQLPDDVRLERVAKPL